MGQNVVLPKFELPGDKPNWVVRIAWITGGLLVFALAGLTFAIMHHRTLESQAEQAKVEAAAKVKAEAEAKVAAAAAAARAAKEAELRAKVAASSEALAANTVPSAASDPGSAPAAKSTRRHHGRSSASKTPKADGIKTASKSSTPKKSDPKKPDAIDELLSKMK